MERRGGIGRRRVARAATGVVVAAAVVLAVVWSARDDRELGRATRDGSDGARTASHAPASHDRAPREHALAPRPEASSSAPPVHDAIEERTGDPAISFDLRDVIARAHFAFREMDQERRFSGGHTTYSVEVDASGATLRAHRSAGAESAPLHVRTASFARGDRELASVPGRAEVQEDGHVAIDRGGVTEHFRNAEDGVEQSWELARRPSGSGDLRVRVEARGLDHVGANEHGQHYADARGIGFRYGHGVWIDASGNETPVEARVVRGAIELVVPSVVLDSSAYPAVLDPTITPEFGIDEPIPSPATDSQERPSVASDGTDYFVAWQDRRSGSLTAIYGARVTAAGAVLDPTGIVIATSSRAALSTPRVASNGTHYLVVWHDGWLNAPVGARVTSAGAIVDATPIAISTGVGRAPSVASNGVDFLVTWHEYTSGWIRAARVSGAGALLDATPLTISSSPSSAVPSVASSGTDYLVVWQDRRATSDDIYGARVTAAGVVLDGTPIAICNAVYVQASPSVAWNGTRYLVAWQDGRSGGGFDVYAARVTSAGSVVDPSGIPISTLGVNEESPSVASLGSEWLVAWSDFRSGTSYDVYASRVADTGSVLDPGGVALTTASRWDQFPSVASSATGYFAAWQNNDSGWNDVYGVRVSSAGVRLDATPTLVSRAANVQNAPRAAWNGSAYLVVWVDHRAGNVGDVYAARVSATGTVLDPTGIAIAIGVNDQAGPAVASDGSGFFVVWSDRAPSVSPYDLYGLRVSDAGVVLDAAPIAISTATGDQSGPAVAWQGSHYLVVWQDGRAGNYDIYGARMTSAGVRVDASGFAISSATSGQFYPAVASNGTNALVVWQDYRSGSAYDVYGARVSGAGAVLDGSGIAISTATSQQQSPSVASNGTDFEVVWADLRSGSSYRVYGSRVSNAGAVLDPSGVALAPGGSDSPAIAASGSDYFVAWRDWRTTSATELYGTRIRGGVIESASGVVLSAEAGREDAPSVAAGPIGSFLLTYERFVPESPLSATRARARIVTYGRDVGNACTLDADCESGFCTDGVCCSTRCGGGSLDCQACSVASGAAADGVCGAATGTSCSDGLGCTAADVCSAGTCVGSGSPCTGSTSCTEGGGGAFACSACPAGTFSVDGTGATACMACGAGTWSGAGATSCLAWTDCAPGEHVASAGTSSVDRTCAACPSGTFSTSVNAASCTGWTSCSPGQEVSAAGTSSSDQVCGACAEGTFSTSTNATSCSAWTECVAGSRIATAGTATTDRTCVPCDVGTFTSTSNADACMPWSECAAGEHVATAGTSVGDRVCAACASGSYSEIVNAASCTPWTDCAPGDFVVLDGSSTADRTCAPCAASTFSASASAASCTPWTDCSPGEQVVADGTSSSDRTCASCASGTFSTETNARACTSWSACDTGQYESGMPSATSDRACSACTACAPDEVEMSACTATADTVCGPIDGGVLDAGIDDGGIDDAGVDDGGADDASVVIDAAAELDASTAVPASTAGCGCTAAGRGARHGGVVLLALLIGTLTRARARRGRPRTSK